MALCPYHLLRPRINAGLSYIPRHRLRIGHLRQVKTNAFSTRSFAAHAPHPDSVALNHDASTDNDTRRTNHFSRFAWGRPSYESALSKVQKEPRESVMKFSLKGRGTEVDGVPMLYTDWFDDSEEPRSMIVLEPGVIEAENKIREKSLFCGATKYAQWREDFRTMRSIKDGQLSDSFLPIPCFRLEDEDYDLFEKLTFEGHQGFRSAWESLTTEDKAERWPRLSLYLLYNSPNLAWEFLYATSQSEIHPPLSMSFYGLGYLRRHHSRQVEKEDGTGGITFEEMIKVVLDPEYWPIIFPPQLGLRLYIKHASQEELQRAYDIVRDRKTFVKAGTWLCFMRQFTHYGDIEAALESLSRLSEGDLDDPTVHALAQWHSAMLLSKDFVSDGPDGRNFYILPRILEMGIQPSVGMMNVVIKNAFKTGDSQLGYDVLEYMQAEGIEVNHYTYVELLRDAVNNGDKRRVQILSEEIRLRPELYRHPYLASKILHARYMFTVKSLGADVDPRMVFENMLDLYNEMHDLTPLKELGILPQEYTPTEPGENNPPSRVALHLILATYLRHQDNLANVVNLYSRFRSLVWEGHPIFARLQATDHVYNEFLAAFRRHPRGLQPAVRLVQEMLQRSAQSQTRSPSTSSRRRYIVPVKPTVWTWNILLSIFVFNKHPLAVEKVKAMMKRHGIKYDHYTWNTIISGQVYDQDLQAVAESLHSMEREGLKLNDRTMDSLSYFRDPERLWKAVQALDDDFESPVDRHRLSAAEPAETDEGGLDQEDEDSLMMKGLLRLQRKA